MQKLVLKGGYGEHGRNCYLVEYKQDHYVMLDCGILDTDSDPYPRLSKDEVKKIDYLILSHAHKDHTGALNHVMELGFDGLIIASFETLYITGVDHSDTMVLDGHGGTMALDGLIIRYGRSGHCPGSFWFHLSYGSSTLFYSGDYQAHPMVYAVDIPHDLDADIALVDMAHDQCNVDAATLRHHLVTTIQDQLDQGHRVILPVQTYGRGNDMLVMLAKAFANISVFIDQRFVNALESVFNEHSPWIEPSMKATFISAYERAKKMKLEEAQVIMIADTHLEKESNKKMVASLVDDGACVIVTGRKKVNSYCAQLLDSGKAIRCLYPHHSSRSDALALVNANHFKVVLPFHSDVKEVW